MSVVFPGCGLCQYSGEVNSRDQPHGLGTAVREDGWRYEGTSPGWFPCYGEGVQAGRIPRVRGREWKEGQWHGMGTRFCPDGTVDTGRWEEDSFKDGTETHPDGRVVKYVNGKRV